MRIVFRLLVFIVIALTAGGQYALAQDATPATGTGCERAAALDLPAVTLTTEDLIEVGLEGFGSSSANL